MQNNFNMQYLKNNDHITGYGHQEEMGYGSASMSPEMQVRI